MSFNFIIILSGTFHSNSDFLEFAQLGVINEFDLFGTECSYYEVQSLDNLDMPNDAFRIEKIKLLIDEGFKVVIAHDIHTRHRLVRKYLSKISIKIHPLRRCNLEATDFHIFY